MGKTKDKAAKDKAADDEGREEFWRTFYGLAQERLNPSPSHNSWRTYNPMQGSDQLAILQNKARRDVRLKRMAIESGE